MAGFFQTFIATGFVGALGTIVVNSPPPDYLKPTGSVTLETPKPRDRFDETRLTDAIYLIAPKYGIPPLLFEAMLDVETAGSGWANRYESHVYNEQKKKHPKASQNELKFRATSHCALQVMGYHVLDAGFAPQDIYEPEICVEMASKVFAGFLLNKKGKVTRERLREAIWRYNGPRGRGVYDVKVLNALQARIDREAKAEIAALKAASEKKFNGLFGDG